jgi:hypothetical protein
MKRWPSLSWALLAGTVASTLFLSSCSTVSSRIDENRADFDRLSPADRALVSQGKIRGGLSQQAVYIAWGRPEQKAVGAIRNVPTETWLYVITTAVPYDYGYPGFYGGFGGSVGYFGRHGHHRFYGAFYEPFYDPFYYPFPATISQPVKTVSFQGGRVIAFQYLTPSY